jgi:Zn-dependent protease
MLEPEIAPEPTVCPGCGTQVAPGLLTCPGCRRLVHAGRLKQLAAEADRAASPAEALAVWQSALELLPSQSKQFEAISARIAALGREVDASPSRPSTAAVADRHRGKGAGLGSAAGVGTLLLVVLSKGKLLLMGLTKAGTLWSMLLSLGVYWAAWGWRFALGLVVSIYIHEMGHVAALLRYGIKASPPLFIPGLGAMIRVRQTLVDPRQDARVGLAGPLWGLGAAAAAALVGLATGAPIWMGIAKIGAWINLFNLLPLAPLDGGRAFHALSRPQRWLAVAALGIAFWVATDKETQGLLVLLILVGVLQAAAGRAPSREQSDRTTLAAYAALVACLTFLAGLSVGLPGG